MKKSILPLALACLATFPCSALAGGMSYADYNAQPRPASSYNKSFTARTYAGYVSRADYNNVIASHWMNASGFFNVGGDVTLPLGRKWSHRIDAQFKAFLDGELRHSDELDAGWHAMAEILPNLHFVGGYDFATGGLGGYIVRRRSTVHNKVAQSFCAGLNYDDSGRGIFASFMAHYGFYGLNGWRLELNGGKRWYGVFNQRINVELSAGASYAFDYWVGDKNGFDELNVKLALPIRLTGADDKRGLSISPFVQMMWTGKGIRKAVNRAVEANAIGSAHLRVGAVLNYNF